jgi:hypothetical protein
MPTSSCVPGGGIERSTLERNGAGVVVIDGSVNVDASVVRDNTRQGSYFGSSLTFAGPASSVTGTTVTGNDYGIYLLIDSDLSVSYWPWGHRNSISGNATRQLHTFETKRDADWRFNYWGGDVEFRTNNAACYTVGTQSVGRLAFASSATSPPAGPINASVYAAGTNLCGYDRVDVRTCEFSVAPVDPSGGEMSVDFEDPVAVSEALDCAARAETPVLELESDFSSVADDLTAIYMPDPEMSSTEVIADHEPMIESLFDEATAFGDYSYSFPGDAPIRRMTISTYEAAPSSFQFPTEICSDPWWPVEGSIVTGPTTQQGYPGQRRVYQTFEWDAANLLYLKACRANLTVEPDAVYDRSDGLTYLGTKVAKFSNLPRRYDDTRRWDGEDETSYTIGTGDAHQLVAGRTYFTLIRAKPGNSSTDRAFVRFQDGVRLPNFCYSTWCIFPAVGSDEIVLGKWQHDVPGSDSWTH